MSRYLPRSESTLAAAAVLGEERTLAAGLLRLGTTSWFGGLPEDPSCKGSGRFKTEKFQRSLTL